MRIKTANLCLMGKKHRAQQVGVKRVVHRVNVVRMKAERRAGVHAGSAHRVRVGNGYRVKGEIAPERDVGNVGRVRVAKAAVRVVKAAVRVDATGEGVAASEIGVVVGHAIVKSVSRGNRL